MSVALQGRFAEILAPMVAPVRSGRSDHRIVLGMMAVSAVLLLVCSSVRHYLLRSGAFDLGFFDQAVFLISRGQTPISSLHNFHVLADHASIILYPLSLLYLIWADPHMLLAAQAVALAAGAWPVWRLSLHAGLQRTQALGMAAAYLMFPLVLTSNLFDFHPDVFIVPALLMAVLAAREDRRISFCLWVALALSCKEIISLTVAAMGVWLLLFERRRFYGVFAIVAGAAWFVISVKLIIPYFGDGRQPSGIWNYTHLGESVGQIVANFFVKPQLFLSQLASLATAKYLIITLVPLAWAIHYRTFWPLLAAVPALMLNLLSSNAAQRSPFYQYSLPIVPFVFISAIAALAAGHAWLRRGRSILAWSIILLAAGFVARVNKVSAEHTLDLQTLRHMKQAISQIDSKGKVLTTFEAVPHVSHRPVVQYIGGVVPLEQLREYQYVLLNTRHSSLDEHDETLTRVIATLTVSPEFHISYASENVMLFEHVHPGLASLR